MTSLPLRFTISDSKDSTVEVEKQLKLQENAPKEAESISNESEMKKELEKLGTMEQKKVLATNICGKFMKNKKNDIIDYLLTQNLISARLYAKLNETEFVHDYLANFFVDEKSEKLKKTMLIRIAKGLLDINERDIFILTRCFLNQFESISDIIEGLNVLISIEKVLDVFLLKELSLLTDSEIKILFIYFSKCLEIHKEEVRFYTTEQGKNETKNHKKTIPSLKNLILWTNSCITANFARISSNSSMLELVHGIKKLIVEEIKFCEFSEELPAYLKTVIQKQSLPEKPIPDFEYTLELKNFPMK